MCGVFWQRQWRCQDQVETARHQQRLRDLTGTAACRLRYDVQTSKKVARAIGAAHLVAGSIEGHSSRSHHLQTLLDRPDAGAGSDDAGGVEAQCT
jgi:hypothetical protein